MAKRRVIQHFAHLHLFLIERQVILFHAALHGVMFQIIRLQYDMALFMTASRSACRLRYQGESAFAGAEVGQI